MGAPFVRLADQNSPTFRIYVQWLYSGRLHTKLYFKEGSEASGNVHRNEWLQLVNAYLLGEKLADTDFRDLVLDACLDWFGEASRKDLLIIVQSVREAYTQLAKNSPLRQLVVDIAAWHFDHQTVKKFQEVESVVDFPKSFLLDMLAAMSARFQGTGSSFGIVSPVLKGRGTCEYHCHGDEKCYKAK